MITFGYGSKPDMKIWTLEKIPVGDSKSEPMQDKICRNKMNAPKVKPLSTENEILFNSTHCSISV